MNVYVLDMPYRFFLARLETIHSRGARNVIYKLYKEYEGIRIMAPIKYNRNYEKYAVAAPSDKRNSAAKFNINIASILNPSTFHSMQDEGTVLDLTAENYQSILNNVTVDFLLAEKIWDNKIAFHDVLNICKKRNIHSVFWETDDGSFINDNIGIARRFDFIFTIYLSNIENYKKLLNTDNVFFLPYAVQARRYNPIEKNIMNKEDMVEKTNVEFTRILGAASKLYSVKYNNTNGSVPREIFEMLALGAPVVSEERKNAFPQIMKEDDLSYFIKNKNEIDKLSVEGQRTIFNSHTYTHRINSILQTIGLDDKLVKKPGVAMITSTNRADSMETIFKNYEMQNYENKELIVILNNNKMDLGEWRSKAQAYKNVKVFQMDEKYPLGRCLNYAIENSDYPYFSKCDDDNYYAPNFLSDLMNTFGYADAEIVGKLSYYCYLEGCRVLAIMCPNMEYRYVNMLSGSAFIIKREVFETVKFRDKPAGSDTVFLKECIQNGIRMYSGDRFNYVYNRHASQENHTWKMKDEIFLKSCKLVDITDDYRTKVTV